MLVGQWEASVDQKGRVIIPSKLREILSSYRGEQLYIALELDGCLSIMPNSVFQNYLEIFQSAPWTNEEARFMKRFLCSNAQICSFDPQGRVLIPANLRARAGIKPGSEVMIVGNADRVEIWNKKRWDLYTRRGTKGRSVSEIMEHFRFRGYPDVSYPGNER